MNNASRHDDIRFWLVCALAIALPILEVPKTVTLVLVVLLTLGKKIFGNQRQLTAPEPLHLVLLAMLMASIISTALNWPTLGHLKGLKDTLFAVSTCWVLYSLNLSERRRYGLAWAVAIGVLIGLVWGVADVYRGKTALLEFNSAGIATQASIYLGVATVMALGLAYAGAGTVLRLEETTFRQRSIWWVLTAIMMLGLFAMGSRGAILAILLIGALLIAITRNLKLMAVLVAMVAVAIALALALPGKFNSARFAEKTEQLVHSKKIDPKNDGIRFDMWRIGLAQFSQGGKPLFGIGPRNFPSIDISRFHFDQPLVAAHPRLHHAHNLFVNKLAEEGVFGLSALLALFGLVAVSLVRDTLAGRWKRWEWFAALGALLVPAIAGFFNTPWHQEHAMLAMMMFGLYLRARKDDFSFN